MSDEVKAPSHYMGNGIECLEAMKSMMHEAPLTPFEGFLWGAAFKYVWRWPFKNGRQDLEKAKRCIDYLLEEES